MNDRYGRIQLLLSQHRNEMAERDLRMMLADEPHDAVAHALLSLCLLQDDQRLAEATDEATAAVGLEPDDPFPHYALAICYLERGRFQEAEAAIAETLRLDPHDADAFSVLARSYLGQSNFKRSLESAESGLAIDPDHIDCGNMRSIALERLGRSQEAILSASETLRRDPDDPMSHAAHGLTLLHAGRYQEAQIAFREALRLDPNNETARSGLIQALNSRSLLFRFVHKFYVAMSRLDSKAALGLVLGAWLLMQVLSRLGDFLPVLRPLILPILVCYVVFVVLTWIANPLFNTFLRFHPFGQHLLDRLQVWASNLIAPCIALSGFGFVAGLFSGNAIAGVIAGAYWIGLAILIAATFSMPTKNRRLLVGAVATAVALLPGFGLFNAIVQESLTPFYGSLQMFAYSLLGIQIVGGIIASQPVKR